MKYPYIGKVEAEGGSSILIKSSKSVGYIIKNNLDDALEGLWEGGYCGDSHIKNITTEYLANTYGEVKSKEHADFIVKLAEVNGIDFDGKVDINSNYFCFFPSNSKQLIFWRKEKDASKHGSRKQITIPLPPECESVDEWPKVGEVVLTASKSKAKVLATYNKKAWVEYVSGSEGFNTLNIASLSKPKTPEQELRDELSDLAFNQFNDDSYDLTHNSYYLAEQLISKYNITKKPQ